MTCDPSGGLEEELETRLAEMRATLESTGDGILVTDPAGGVRNYNRRFIELWEVPAEVVDSMDAAQLLQRIWPIVWKTLTPTKSKWRQSRPTPDLRGQ